MLSEWWLVMVAFFMVGMATGVKIGKEAVIRQFRRAFVNKPGDPVTIGTTCPQCKGQGMVNCRTFSSNGRRYHDHDVDASKSTIEETLNDGTLP